MHSQNCNSILFFQLGGGPVDLTRSAKSDFRFRNTVSTWGIKADKTKTIEMQNLIFVSEILFGMRLPCIMPQKRGEWAWFPFWSYSQDLRLGQALTKAITNVLNTYPPQDSVGSDTQTGVALVQYPYWPLTRVAYLRTEGRPPHRSEISLGIFLFWNISMFMIHQIKWSIFW